MPDVNFVATFDDSAVQTGLNGVVNSTEKAQGAFDELGNKAEAAMNQANGAAQGTAAQFQGAEAAVKKTSIATTIFSRALGILRKAVIATGIGALVIAVTTLATAILKSNAVSERFSNIMGGLRNIVNELIERFLILGKGLLAILSGDIVGGLTNIGQAVTGIGTALGEAYREGVELEKQLRRIAEGEADLADARAANAADLVRLKDIRDDETRSFRERQRAAKESSELQRSLIREEVFLAQQRLDVANRQAERSKEQRRDSEGNIKLTDEQREAQRRVNELQAEALGLDIDARNAQEGLRKAAREAAAARREELDALNKQAAAFLLQVERLASSQLTGIERVRAERKLALDALDEQEKELRRIFAERGKQFNLEADFERARALVAANASREIREIYRQEERERAVINEKRAASEKAAVDEERKEALRRIEVGREVLLARAGLIERGTETEEEFLIASERRKLKIELDAAKAREDILAAQYGETSLEVQLIRAQIALIEKEYADVGEINLTAFDRLKKNILSALQISEEELGLLASSAASAVSSITGLIDAGIDAQIAQQDRLLKSLRDRIRETEGLLREEQRRQQEGYANNADALRESLEQQLAAEQAAEQRRAQLKAQQVKREARQNQIQAVSEYALLVVKLLSAEASKGIIGIAIGIAGLALVARLIAQQKQIAAKTFEGLREGTEFITGPGTSKSDSVIKRLSVGERVVPADINAELGGRALSNDDLSRYVSMGKILDTLLSSRTLSAFNRSVSGTGEKAAEMEQAINYAAMSDAYGKAAEGSAEKIIQAIREQPVVIPIGDKTRVERTSKTKKRIEMYQAK